MGIAKGKIVKAKSKAHAGNLKNKPNVGKPFSSPTKNKAGKESSPGKAKANKVPSSPKELLNKPQTPQKKEGGSPEKKSVNNTPKTATTNGETLNKRQIQRQKSKQKKLEMKEKLAKVKEGLLDTSAVDLESINKKIEALTSGGLKTNTAKRRLRELKKMQKLAEGKPVEAVKKPATKSDVSKAAKRRARRGTHLNKDIEDQKLQNDIWEQDTKKSENRLQEIHSKKNKTKDIKKNIPVIESPKAQDSDEDSESDYEVEHMVKADKITKKLSAKVGIDSDEESDDENENEEEMEVEEDDEDESNNVKENDSDEDDESDENEDNSNDSDEDDKPMETQEQANKNTANKKKLNLINKVEGKDKPQNPKKEKQNQDTAEKIKNLVVKKDARYVLFVGNLPYSAQKSTLEEHFSKAGEVKDIRLALEKGTNKPRGFAYIEMCDSESYQKAFSLHHTMIEGRRINVEYTQPGHNKSDDKKKRVKAKNFKLSAMRKQGMLAGSTKPGQKRSFRRNKAKGKNSEKTEG